MTKLEIENEIEQINNEFGLTCENGIVTTTSLKVAEIYGKDHGDVLKKIRKFIELIPELGQGNFSESSYINEQNKEQPMFNMDRQGFSMLVNKFTGDEATIFTYKYTLAFERLVELVDMLSEENEELYQIAVSDKCQLEREYEADKIKYSVRNISTVLSSVKYTELEDTINKIIDVHTHLKKSDRYEYHQKLTNTEYKKKIMAIVAAVVLIVVVVAAGIAVTDKSKSNVKHVSSKKTETCPIDFDEWKQQNEEVYAYIEVPNTDISYPI